MRKGHRDAHGEHKTVWDSDNWGCGGEARHEHCV